MLAHFNLLQEEGAIKRQAPNKILEPKIGLTNCTSFGLNCAVFFMFCACPFASVQERKWSESPSPIWDIGFEMDSTNCTPFVQRSYVARITFSVQPIFSWNIEIICAFHFVTLYIWFLLCVFFCLWLLYYQYLMTIWTAPLDLKYKISIFQKD